MYQVVERYQDGEVREIHGEYVDCFDAYSLRDLVESELVPDEDGNYETYLDVERVG